ncbi:hypothetical protein WDU94_013855 [Cyamophila willieti]
METVLTFPDITASQVIDCQPGSNIGTQDIVVKVIRELIAPPPGGENSEKLEKDVEKAKEKEETVWLRQEMLTGSSFEGEINYFNMNGAVRYTMTHGVVFEGTMSDGMFHGAGVLRYESGAALHGVWNEGHLVQINKYTYKDGLTRSLDDTVKFDYCEKDDRRGWSGRKVQLTNEKTARYIPGKYYDVVDGFLDLSIQWVLDRDTLQPIRHASTSEEIQTSMKHCRKGWHEYTSPVSKDPIDTLPVRKAYKAVPGLESDKKQLKLERKLEILKYKINHEIATEEDIALYCAIMRGHLTRSMVSSEPVSLETEESSRASVSSKSEEHYGQPMSTSPLTSRMFHPSSSLVHLPPSEAECMAGSDKSSGSTVTLNIPRGPPPLDVMCDFYNI